MIKTSCVRSDSIVFKNSDVENTFAMPIAFDVKFITFPVMFFGSA